MTVFDMFKTSVQGFLSSYTLYITSKVSLDRMDDFLRNVGASLERPITS
jgi:hypothetical protein